MTTGEQMLVDCGYKIHKTQFLIWFEKENEIGEEDSINFSPYDKNMYFDFPSNRKVGLTTEETEAMYQIIKDYGWFS